MLSEKTKKILIIAGIIAVIGLFIWAVAGRSGGRDVPADGEVTFAYVAEELKGIAEKAEEGYGSYDRDIMYINLQEIEEQCRELIKKVETMTEKEGGK